jgi:hypothetical protein
VCSSTTVRKIGATDPIWTGRRSWSRRFTINCFIFTYFQFRNYHYLNWFLLTHILNSLLSNHILCAPRVAFISFLFHNTILTLILILNNCPTFEGFVFLLSLEGANEKRRGWRSRSPLTRRRGWRTQTRLRRWFAVWIKSGPTDWTLPSPNAVESTWTINNTVLCFLFYLCCSLSERRRRFHHRSLDGEPLLLLRWQAYYVLPPQSCSIYIIEASYSYHQEGSMWVPEPVTATKCLVPLFPLFSSPKTLLLVSPALGLVILCSKRIVLLIKPKQQRRSKKNKQL